MGNALIKTINGRPVAVPLTTLRIVTHIGAGDVRYLTSDGWVGVHVDGDPERRVDEVYLGHLSAPTRIDLERAGLTRTARQVAA